MLMYIWVGICHFLLHISGSVINSGKNNNSDFETRFLSKNNNTNVNMASLLALLKLEKHDFDGVEKSFTEPRTRKKRQASGGAGKFMDAAKMPQIKMFRIFLQLFKNAWDPVYVGGTSPFHPVAPKTAVWFFKDKIVNFFFPDVGALRQKKSH